MSDLRLICIPPEEVYKIWRGTVHDMIDAGFAASDVPMPDDIAEQLKYGRRLLWVVTTPDAMIVAAMLTQLFDMRSGKLCKMMECGGARLSEWAHFRGKIEQYAKAEGCDRVLVEGRVGWAAMLTDYRVTGVTLEKRI
jgi:hypothetical protein